MTDTVSPEVRSAMMSGIRGKDTKPEMVVRRLLHRLGYRFRLHGKDLPGKPDLVFTARRKVVFVHGCFWHGHGCKVGRLPKSRTEYWLAKINGNRDRDSESVSKLEAAGWSVLVLWECDIRAAAKDSDPLTDTLRMFFGEPRLRVRRETVAGHQGWSGPSPSD